MRIAAAIFALLFGTSVAFAQGDVRAPYGPQATAAAAKPANTTTKPARAAKPAVKPDPTPAPKRAAAPAKPKPAPAKPKPAVPKPKAKPAVATPKPRPVPQRPEQAVKPTPATAAKPDSNTTPATPVRIDQTLRESYAAIPVAERVALQSDLIWTGDYNGLLNGEFSERLVEAVKSYQKRQNDQTTGLLNPQERAALRAAARPRQSEVGWRLVEDPTTGARVGLPLKLATKRESAATGTRWSSQQGQLQIETFRIDTGATLESVFEQQKKAPQRRVTYHVLRDDFFVVSGTQGLKKFYVRGVAQATEVRGITILYDQAMAGLMDPIVVAMSNAFAPFATYAVASIADAPARKRVEYATGLVVSPAGHIVTAREAVESCELIVVPRLGNAEHVAAGSEVALIRVYGARKLAPIGFAGTASAGSAVTLVGIADPQAQGGGAAVTTAAAKVGAGVGLLPLEPPPAPGFSGAAVLGGNGAVLGIAVLKPAVIAGAASAPQAAVMPASAIRSFLEAHQVVPASGQPGVDHAKVSVVRVICVRK
jgi:outer membrane biosynthesis protein TonB